MIQLLRNAWRCVNRNEVVRHTMNAVGLPAVAKRSYHHWLLRRGEVSATLFDQRLRFAVTHAGEINRIDCAHAESDLVHKLVQCIQPGDVVWDVGANIGVISLIVAAHVRHQGVQVHAFEPEPRNADRLRTNVAINGLHSIITVHQLALASFDGTVDLHVSGEVGEGSHSLLHSPSGQSADAVAVPAATVSALAATENIPPNVMKIDVEGAEFQVLAGAKPLFESGGVRELFMEIHPSRLVPEPEIGSDHRPWLEALGFHCRWSAQRGSQVHEHWSRSP